MLEKLNTSEKNIMNIASTAAAVAYTDMLSKFDWDRASTAKELVLLGRLETLLSGFPRSTPIYEFGIDSANGGRSVQTVEEVLGVIRTRQQSKSQFLLASVGGKVCDKRREILKAEMQFESEMGVVS